MHEQEMSEQEEYQSGKFVVTILLVNGTKYQHQYDLPVTLEQGKLMMDMVFAALDKKGRIPLSFDNPVTIYNPDNVLGVQFHFVTLRQMKEFRKHMKIKMGLLPDEE